MPFENERAAIEDRFDQLYAAANPTVQVCYEGRNFTRPNGDTSWIALIILGGPGARASLGPNAVFRRHGIIQFNIHTAAQNGSNAARKIADDLSAIFNDVDLSVNSGEVIRTQTSHLKPLGIRDGKYAVVLSVPFVHDSIDPTSPYQNKPRRLTYTGAINGTNTVYVLSYAPTAASVQVYWNGVLQAPSSYTLVGTTLTMNVAPGSGDTLEVFG